MGTADAQRATKSPHVIVARRHRGQSPDQGLAGVRDEPGSAHRSGQAEVGRPAAEAAAIALGSGPARCPCVPGRRASSLPVGETAAIGPAGGFEAVERAQWLLGRVQQDHGLHEVADPA